MPIAVTFLPERRTVTLEEPADLALAASRADIWLEQPCGARATCGKCRVRLSAGEAPETDADRRVLPAGDRAHGWRLGCQLQVAAACTVEVPQASRAVPPKSFGPITLAPPAMRPVVRRAIIDAPRPDLARPLALLDLVAAGLAGATGGRVPLRAPVHVLHELPALAAAHPRLAAILCGRDLLHVEAAGTPDAPLLGVAVDLGSTTLAAALVDLAGGRVLATAARLNPQARHGADVISRIHFANERPGGLGVLHEEIAGAGAALIEELLAGAAARADRIFAIACAGNATMTHTAVGAPIGSLGEAPYTGVFTQEWQLPARALRWPAHPEAQVRFLPMVGRHVGGDTVAAAIACDLDRGERWRLLVDLGTNAEVVLAGRGRILATSTAAGPAFEGATIACGMRAVPGAIDMVRVMGDGRIACGTIAGTTPAGLCGSGLVDAVAELLRAGVIAPSGYLRGQEECAALGLPSRLIGQVATDAAGQRIVRLTDRVHLGAGDVRQLQLVKGSTAAGIALLLRHAGLDPRELDEILLAGAFGSFLRKASALAIGLVPAIDPERVRFVGNAAGAGVRLALVDARARRRAAHLARDAEYVELAGRPDYETAFCDAIPFPDPREGA